MKNLVLSSKVSQNSLKIQCHPKQSEQIPGPWCIRKWLIIYAAGVSYHTDCADHLNVHSCDVCVSLRSLKMQLVIQQIRIMFSCI